MKYNAILFTIQSNYLTPGPMNPGTFTSESLVMKAAGAYSIANYLRTQNYKTKVIDYLEYMLSKGRVNDLMSYLDSIIDSETLIIGFSTTFLPDNYNAKAINLFIHFLKKKFPHVKIIVGGAYRQAKKFVEQSEGQIDCWVDGFGELAIVEVIKKIQNNESLPKEFNYDRNSIEYNFHNMEPMFSHDHDVILSGEVLPIEISRGCRFACKFCDTPLTGKDPKDQRYVRSKESITKELVYNYKHFDTTNYYIMCATFNESTEKLLLMQEAIKDAGIKIELVAYTRLDLLHVFPEQIDILKDIGMKSAFFGIESLHDPALKGIGKGIGREKILSTLNIVREKWGPEVFLHGAFIAGLPHDSEETINEWANFIYNKKTPLNSFRIVSLGIYNDSGTNASLFEKDPKRYGFNIDTYSSLTHSSQWTSDIHSISSEAQAMDIAKYWNNKFIYASNIGNPWVAMSLRNYNYSWDEIFNVRNTDEDMLKISKCKERFIELYYSKLYESK